MGCTSQGWSSPVAILVTRRRGAALPAPASVAFDGDSDADGDSSVGVDDATELVVGS